MTQSRERVKEANGKVQVVNLLPTAVEAATRLVQLMLSTIKSLQPKPNCWISPVAEMNKVEEEKSWVDEA